MHTDKTDRRRGWWGEKRGRMTWTRTRFRLPKHTQSVMLWCDIICWKLYLDIHTLCVCLTNRGPIKTGVPQKPHINITTNENVNFWCDRQTSKTWANRVFQFVGRAGFVEWHACQRRSLPCVYLCLLPLHIYRHTHAHTPSCIALVSVRIFLQKLKNSCKIEQWMGSLEFILMVLIESPGPPQQ